jgi:hypothetical protein
MHFLPAAACNSPRWQRATACRRVTQEAAPALGLEIHVLNAGWIRQHTEFGETARR